MLRREVLWKVPQLSVHDGFAFALAEDHPGCILLTGDSKLRALAKRHAIEVHGVLWVLDEIYRMRLASAAALLAALRLSKTTQRCGYRGMSCVLTSSVTKRETSPTDHSNRDSDRFSEPRLVRSGFAMRPRVAVMVRAPMMRRCTHGPRSRAPRDRSIDDFLNAIARHGLTQRAVPHDGRLAHVSRAC